MKSKVVDLFHILLRTFRFSVFLENTEYGASLIYHVYTLAQAERSLYMYIQHWVDVHYLANNFLIFFKERLSLSEK